jgi:hypothetical protein
MTILTYSSTVKNGSDLPRIFAIVIIMIPEPILTAKYITPSEMFLQRLSTSSIHTTNKQQSVTHVGNQKGNLSKYNN